MFLCTGRRKRFIQNACQLPVGTQASQTTAPAQTRVYGVRRPQSCEALAKQDDAALASSGSLARGENSKMSPDFPQISPTDFNCLDEKKAETLVANTLCLL
jgi:hypothetical protein